MRCCVATAAVLVLAAATLLVPQQALPCWGNEDSAFVGVDDNALHINSSASSRVFINGVDVLAELSGIQSQIELLQQQQGQDDDSRTASPLQGNLTWLAVAGGSGAETPLA